jgi:hypothetical protein
MRFDDGVPEMIKTPRDALVLAALIMVPTYLAAGYLGPGAGPASPSEAAEPAEPHATSTPSLALATVPAADIDIDDWFAESAVDDTFVQDEAGEGAREPEPAQVERSRLERSRLDRPLPDPADTAGVQADIRKAVAALDAKSS